MYAGDKFLGSLAWSFVVLLFLHLGGNVDAKALGVTSLHRADLRIGVLHHFPVAICAKNLDWLNKATNLLLFGPPGAGKTYTGAQCAVSRPACWGNGVWRGSRFMLSQRQGEEEGDHQAHGRQQGNSRITKICGDRTAEDSTSRRGDRGGRIEEPHRGALTERGKRGSEIVCCHAQKGPDSLKQSEKHDSEQDGTPRVHQRYDPETDQCHAPNAHAYDQRGHWAAPRCETA